MNYTVVTKQTSEDFSVWVPGLPGCWSGGNTEAEALANIEDAIVDYLAVAKNLSKREAGAKTHVVRVKVA